jgi:precorrin-6Y C5,15-methyltransferase (decarboxylating)
MSEKWLSIVGIGEDGLPGLSAIAQSTLSQAQIVVGGKRHLAMLPLNDTREKISWSSPLDTTINEIISRRGQSICVLASGDPMCHGIGVTLTRFIPIAEITIIPAPSAFSLACARLGWSLEEVEKFSLTNRPPSVIQPAIYPGARLLILSAGSDSPALIADILTQRGYGNSQITVLECMEGSNERIIQGVVRDWYITDIASLNTIAIECIPELKVTPLPRVPGLPDAVYHHDGQLTKREVRAIVLAALAPTPGILWDVGAGCGSISIEWMRTHPLCRAIAIEQNLSRLEYITDNANALGTPNLEIILGKAPDVLKNLPQPDAIFIGGGVTTENLLETCWQALASGGRLVANAVTVESELKLLQWHNQYGGELTRIAIQRAEPLGKFLTWRSLAPITQWVGVRGAGCGPVTCPHPMNN